jgi:hypothetical protein
VLLVNRGVTTQAPSNKLPPAPVATPPPRTLATKEIQSQKISVVFNIKQQRTIFLELNCKEGMNM